MRRITAAILHVFVPFFVSAAGAETRPVLNLKFQSADLVFNVENLAGAIADIQVKETATEIKIELSGDVLFDFDKVEIKKAAEPLLANVAEIVNKHPQSSGIIEGHTDSKGSDDYNLKLSHKRAESVKNWLVDHASVSARRFSTKGLGELKPVAPNTNSDGTDNPEGRQKNRRVEIVVKKVS